MSVQTPLTRERRLAWWTLLTILIADLWGGIAWTIGSPKRTSTKFYEPARAVFSWLPGDPARGWGVLLLVLTLAALLAVLIANEAVLQAAFILLSAYWSFWFMQDIFVASESSLTAPAFALIILIGHVRAAVTGIRLQGRHLSTRGG